MRTFRSCCAFSAAFCDDPLVCVCVSVSLSVMQATIRQMAP